MHWTGRRSLGGLLAAALLAGAATADEAVVLECTAEVYLWPEGNRLDAGHYGEYPVRHQFDAAKGLLLLDVQLDIVLLEGQVLRRGEDTVFLSDPTGIGEAGLATVTFVHNAATGLFTAVIRFLTQPEIRALGEDDAWRDQFTAPLDHLFTEWGTCTGATS